MNSQFNFKSPFSSPPKLLKLIDSHQFRSLNQFNNVKEEESTEKAFMTKYVEKMKKNVNGETITINRIINILKLHQLLRNQSQLEKLKQFFDENFPYIGKFKDKLEGTKCLEIFRFMTIERYKALNVIFRHGEVGRKMYFLLQGEAAIFIPRNKQSSEVQNLICHDFKDLMNIQFQEFSLVATKKFGDVFGEIAIEQKVTRTATVVAKTDVYVGLLSYEMYQDIIGKYQNLVIAQKLEFINKLPLFQDWEQKEKLIILSSFEQQTRNCGSVIFQKGQQDEYIYLVISGEIEIVKSQQTQSSILNKNVYKQQPLALINSGQFFGDYEHLLNIPQRVTTAKTKMETTFYRIKYGLFIDLIDMYSNLEEFKQAQIAKFKIQEGFSKKYDQINQRNQSTYEPVDLDMNQLKKNYFLNQKVEQQKQEISKQIFKTRDHKKKDHYKDLMKSLSQTLSVHEAIQLNKYSNLIPHKHDFFVNEEKCIQSPNRTFQQKFFKKIIEKVAVEPKPVKPTIPKFFEQNVKYHLATKFKNRKESKSQNANSELSQSDSISFSRIIKHRVAKLNLQTCSDSQNKLTLEKILKTNTFTPQTQLSLHIRSYHKEHIRQSTNRSIQSRSHRVLSRKQDFSESRKLLQN